MNTDELKEIRLWLALHLGKWREFAKAAGVPYSTLEKVARGITKNPRYGTYDKIRQEWLRRRRKRPYDVDQDPIAKQRDI